VAFERFRSLGTEAAFILADVRHEDVFSLMFPAILGPCREELTAQLRTARRMRRPKSHNAKSGQGHILDMVSIRERPSEIEDRAVPGHWEGSCRRPAT
jgi:IS30 family transposase